MKKINDLKEVDAEVDEEFEFFYSEYKNDFRLQTYFNKLFGINLKRAYCTTKLHAKGDDLDWDWCHIVLILENGNRVYMNNSEWAAFKFVKGFK